MKSKSIILTATALAVACSAWFGITVASAVKLKTTGDGDTKYFGVYWAARGQKETNLWIVVEMPCGSKTESARKRCGGESTPTTCSVFSRN